MQRYFAKEKIEKEFILEDGDIHHITHVMRMNTGNHIEVVYENTLYECEINFNNGLNIKQIKTIENLNKNTGLVLIIPVLKEQKMDLVLQKATELGVYKIIPIITERCVVKTDGKEEKKLERWKKIVKEASEQSKRLSVPIIDKIRVIDELDFNDGVKLVCSTQEKVKKIKKVMQSFKKCAKMYIVVGPEGGLTTKEENKLNDKGFISVSLGERILRVETVPLFILSIIIYELME